MTYLYAVYVIPQFAVAVLAVRHVRSDFASPPSKRFVGGLTAFAVLAPHLWPAFLPLRNFVVWTALPLQFVVSFYIAFYQIIWSPRAAPPAPRDIPRESPVGKPNAGSDTPEA